MSSETGVRRMSPVNSHVVCFASIPEVPSKTLGGRRCHVTLARIPIFLVTCTTAFDPLTSSTCPLRFEPSASVSETISAYLGNYGDRAFDGFVSRRRIAYFYAV